MNTSLSFSVLTANVISLLLLSTLYLSNRQKMNFERGMKIILRMMGITAVSNIADCCVFYFASTSNAFLKALVFLSGSWLYLGNVLIGYTWAQFLMTHLNIPFTDARRKIYRAGGIAACVLLILNIFYPLVFNVRDGLYQRGPAYSAFLLFAVLYILDSLYLYAGCRKKAGTLKLFPVQVFLFPIAVSLLIQTFLWKLPFCGPRSQLPLQAS